MQTQHQGPASVFHRTSNKLYNAEFKDLEERNADLCQMTMRQKLQETEAQVTACTELEHLKKKTASTKDKANHKQEEIIKFLEWTLTVLPRQGKVMEVASSKAQFTVAVPGSITDFHTGRFLCSEKHLGTSKSLIITRRCVSIRFGCLLVKSQLPTNKSFLIKRQLH